MRAYNRMKKVIRQTLVVVGLFSSTSVFAVEARKDYPIVPLLKGNKTILGEEFTYPQGRPDVTAAILVLAPGARTLTHRHGVPLFVYVLEGVIDVDYGAKGKRTYKAGDAFMEAMSVAHYGMNNSQAPVRLLAVYMGAADAPDVIPEK
jgi:quercetin dioxygenase-like cupin family protein